MTLPRFNRPIGLPASLLRFAALAAIACGAESPPTGAIPTFDGLRPEPADSAAPPDDGSAGDGAASDRRSDGADPEPDGDSPTGSDESSVREGADEDAALQAPSPSDGPRGDPSADAPAETTDDGPLDDDANDDAPSDRGADDDAANVDPPPGAPNPEFPTSAGTPRVYLASDSTVQTYGPNQAPQQGWGQRIAEFFTDDVIIVNRAIGGRSSKSFIDEGRLDEIVNDLERGDYLFAQWGINDRYRSDPTRFTDPETTFRDYLRQYVEAAQSRSAIPVLVTPTPRLHFENGAFQNDFAGYCTAIEAVGEETGTRVIDLQTRGLAYYESLGLDEVEASISLDVLHFKTEGAFQMARLVSEGVRDSDLPIRLFVISPE